MSYYMLQFTAQIQSALMCAVQTGLERVVRMSLTIGLIVWVFQSQAQMDRKVYRNYIDIRKYDLLSSFRQAHACALAHSKCMHYAYGSLWHTCAKHLLFAFNTRLADNSAHSTGHAEECLLSYMFTAPTGDQRCYVTQGICTILLLLFTGLQPTKMPSAAVVTTNVAVILALFA